jgi:hypothetical protein
VSLVVAEGDPEVGQRWLAPLVEQDVGRLDVAVHDAGLVGRGQCAHEPARLAVDLVGRRGAVLRDPLGEAAARHVRHDQHDLVALVDDVDQRHDVGVVQLAEHGGLAQQPLARPGDLRSRALQGQPLERDLVAVLVTREVDDTHAPAPEARDQVVVAVGHRTQRLGRRHTAAGRAPRPRRPGVAARPCRRVYRPALAE